MEQKEENIVRAKPTINPRIVVFLGHSCSGKDLCQKLYHECSRYPTVVLTTSRPIREGEVNGVNYNFISKRKFKELILNDAFVDYKEYHTLLNNKPDVWYYGIQKNQMNRKNKVMVADPESLPKIKEYYGPENVLTVWVECPDDVRRERNKSRGDYDEVEFNRRLKVDKKRFKGVQKHCDCTLVNDYESNETLAKDIQNLFDLTDFIFTSKKIKGIKKELKHLTIRTQK